MVKYHDHLVIVSQLSGEKCIDSQGQACNRSTQINEVVYPDRFTSR